MTSLAAPARRPSAGSSSTAGCQYRRTFRATLFSSFLTPVLFLTAMGLGLGGYVDRPRPPTLGGVPYLEFLAPGPARGDGDADGLVRGGVPDHRRPRSGPRSSTRCTRRRSAPRDIALGNLVWIAVRLTLDRDGVHAGHRRCSGRPRRRSSCSAIPAAVLTGLAFAAPIAAFTATQKTPNKFAAIFRFGITPLFLFTGTFFPIERLPAFLQPIAWLTPLCHGVGADPRAVARDHRRRSGRWR